MDQELEAILFKKYPHIFKQKDDGKGVTCLDWGIECGDGWFRLLDELCNSIQQYIDRVRRYEDGKKIRPEQVEAIQVKEKFGTLRFYTNGACPEIEGMIFMAECMSAKTCESCGSITRVSQTKGWISTLCEDCGGTIDSIRKGNTREK